jgi:perosamine synthetase
MKGSICVINSSVRDVLTSINEEPSGVAFVIDQQERLIGVLTDGDIRRMLLNGVDLNAQIAQEDLGSYVFANQGEKLEDILKKTDKKVRIIPIIDTEGKPVDYFRYEHRVKMIPVAEPKLNGNEFKYLTDAFLSTWISSAGAYINRFESEFSEYCGAKYGVAVSNGTVAIHLALESFGIGEGDEVIVPDLTFAATINAVLHANATTVIVDVDPVSWCISPEAIEKAITPKTKAIIPVHVYGQPCDMDPIMALAEKHNLFVVEDAAEAHGAVYKGRKVGSIGHAATFSFFGNKIITTGEGGMVVTNSDQLNDRMRVLRDHGMSKQKRYWHEHIGYNYRMTNLQAAIGCAQLERIDEIIAGRAEIESKYQSVLADFSFVKWQPKIDGNKRVTWLVAALLEDGIDRDGVIQQLRDNGVDARPFFYQLSDMPIYSTYVSGNLDASKLLSRQGLNLPTIDGVDFDRVVKAFEEIKETFK